MTAPAHWDEAEGGQRSIGHLAGRWSDLGIAAGSVDVGLRRIQVEPGKWSTPAHVHDAEEEIFFVVGGSGLSWQDGSVYEIRAGDCVVYLADDQAHTVRAGADGLDVLAFGPRETDGTTHLPRARATWLGVTWIPAGDAEGTPWDREAAAGEPEVREPADRPASIVALDGVPADEFDRGDSRFARRNLGRAAGSRKTGLQHLEIAPGAMGWPPHCHSADEELFVVLGGDGALLLGDEEHPLRRGSLVSRPPGTRVAHAFRAGDGGLQLLAYGTREPNDIAYYPRSGKVYLRGIGVMGRIEPLDYWDGEA